MKYRNLFVTLLIGALVVIATFVGTFLVGRAVLRSTARMESRLAAIKCIDDFLLTMTTAETGQRGYLLTGEESYLKPYEAAMPQVTVQLANLAGNPMFPRASIENLATLSRQKLDELAATIELRKAQGAAAALQRVQTNQGRNLMEKIRSLVFDARTAQQEQVEREVTEDARLAKVRLAGFAMGTLINLGFLAWAYSRISHDQEKQREAYALLAREREEVYRQKELLNVTLASIGDCVIVTGLDGRITFLNEVAAELTGWSRAEAISRPVAEVFNIINEQTRMPVESPVDKVLASGKTVGLANHTVLIRKDGSEVPIDDSGAPIRESTGDLRGVVLIFRDFSDHKNAENELIKAKSNAEAASQAKDRFLAMLSHELRTPLAPVLATLNRWEMTNELPPTIQVDVEMLRCSVELEARIIDDLLDLTRISKGMLSLMPETINVHALLEPLAGMYRSEVHAKGLHLEMNLNAARPFVRLDGSRLQQVMWNILRNAAKFTDRGGRVIVATRNDDGGDIIIRISDTGIGMDEGTISRLFIPFEQGEKDISRRYGGLGLGLAISRGLVNVLGGKIAAYSDGLGRGSVFEVTFPSIEVHPEMLSAINETDSHQKGLASLRILLVEDHVDTGLAMSRLLKARGHEVYLANSVGSACEVIDTGIVDIMLCDLGLPDGSGIDVVRHLRQGGNTPAIALSGFGMEEDLARSFDAGFDLHLTKPVNVRQLEGSIGKLMDSRKSAG